MEAEVVYCSCNQLMNQLSCTFHQGKSFSALVFVFVKEVPSHGDTLRMNGCVYSGI